MTDLDISEIEDFSKRLINFISEYHRMKFAFDRQELLLESLRPVKMPHWNNLGLDKELPYVHPLLIENLSSILSEVQSLNQEKIPIRQDFENLSSRIDKLDEKLSLDVPPKKKKLLKGWFF